MSTRQKVMLGCLFAILGLDLYYVSSLGNHFPRAIKWAKETNCGPKDPMSAPLFSTPWKKTNASTPVPGAPSETIFGYASLQDTLLPNGAIEGLGLDRSHTSGLP